MALMKQPRSAAAASAFAADTAQLAPKLVSGLSLAVASGSANKVDGLVEASTEGGGLDAADPVVVVEKGALDNVVV